VREAAHDAERRPLDEIRHEGVDVPGLGRSDWRARSVLRALHRSRQPLLLYPEGWREGLEDATNPSGTGFIASWDRTYRGVFAGGARALRADVRHAARPKELRLAGIKTVEAANAWLKAHYIAEHNAAFAIKAEQQGTAFVADRHEAWREALCVIEERTVGNDNTIAWSGRRLQLPESRPRPHFVKAVVRVHAYPDGTVSVFLGPHRLTRFSADGQQISPDAPQPGSVLGAVKDKPLRARKRASLTAPAPAAAEIARVGAEKRASSRTKKPTRRANQTAISMA